jgi:hypothetical protein
VATPVLSKLGGKFLRFSQGGAGSRGGLVPWVAKPLLPSPSNVLTHDSKSPGVSMLGIPDFRNKGGGDSLIDDLGHITGGGDWRKYAYSFCWQQEVKHT